ncbi:glycosyltransferase [Christiangramia aquimixticola]|uniref:glycosyltransferase n=1 Tax=Christiangramia aquimixticola TaxID=1697558 RepID=UPI003AA92C04
MKVLQIIDTLEAGGAEHMAVNYANALQNKVTKSYICSTRKEGILKEKILKEVGYFYLNKTSKIDLKAYIRLKNYLLEHKIDIVHAHSSSYYQVVLIKIFAIKKLKIVWHDHYGNSDFLDKRPGFLIRLFSRYFNGIITVNTKLETWSKQNLKCSNIKVIRNFLPLAKSELSTPIFLKGYKKEFKYICVANLRPQKDHLTLIEAFEGLDVKNVSLHLVGKEFKDEYSREILNRIQNSPKSNKIYYYGSQKNIKTLLGQADAGVLSSRSEGLPLALLEYGLSGLPVICTDVGECRKVLEDFGILVPPSNSKILTEAMSKVYYDYNARIKADAFHKIVRNQYSESANISEILKFYQSL